MHILVYAIMPQKKQGKEWELDEAEYLAGQLMNNYSTDKPTQLDTQVCNACLGDGCEWCMWLGYNIFERNEKGCWDYSSFCTPDGKEASEPHLITINDKTPTPAVVITLNPLHGNVFIDCMVRDSGWEQVKKEYKGHVAIPYDAHV